MGYSQDLEKARKKHQSKEKHFKSEVNRLAASSEKASRRTYDKLKRGRGSYSTFDGETYSTVTAESLGVDISKPFSYDRAGTRDSLSKKYSEAYNRKKHSKSGSVYSQKGLHNRMYGKYLDMKIAKTELSTANKAFLSQIDPSNSWKGGKGQSGVNSLFVKKRRKGSVGGTSGGTGINIAK